MRTQNLPMVVESRSSGAKVSARTMHSRTLLHYFAIVKWPGLSLLSIYFLSFFFFYSSCKSQRRYFKRKPRGTRTVAQQVKPPLAILTSLIWVLVQVLGCLFSSPAPCFCTWKTAENDPSAWGSASNVGDSHGVLGSCPRP